MAQSLIAWLKGKDPVASRGYDFIPAPPFWKTWWFRLLIIAIGIVTLFVILLP